jgi:hypothetical protein
MLENPWANLMSGRQLKTKTDADKSASHRDVINDSDLSDSLLAQVNDFSCQDSVLE